MLSYVGILLIYLTQPRHYDGAAWCVVFTHLGQMTTISKKAVANGAPQAMHGL